MEDDDCIILSSDEDEPQRDVQPPTKKAKPSPKEEQKEENGPSSSNAINGASKRETRQSEIQCIDIDDDEDSKESNLASSSSASSNPEKRATAAVEDLVYKLRNFLKPSERAKVKDKLFRKLGKLDLTSASTANELTVYIEGVMQKISSDPKHKWTKLYELFTFMNSNKADSSSSAHTSNAPLTPSKKDKNETTDERAERKKKEKIIKIEKKLKEIEKEIERWDRREVDLDDERNSSYLVKSRMEKKYMEIYELLCRETNCNTYTGRPIEKKIKLPKDVTRYPEINMAVEKFINGKDILFIPDYHDIETIVEDINKTSQPPLLPASDVSMVTKILFHQLLKIMRSRRHQDFEISVPLLKTVDDPAEHDSELEKKLKENTKLHKSEQEVIESFVQKQLELQEAQVEVPVEDNADGSAVESDDESDDEEEEDEEGEQEDEDGQKEDDGLSVENDDEDSNEAVVERKIYTREEAGDTDSEEEEEKENETDISDSNNVAAQDSAQNDDKDLNKNGINGETKKGVLDTVQPDEIEKDC